MTARTIAPVDDGDNEHCVLLIASHKTVLDSLKQMMESVGCRALLARNRRSALRHARHSSPDLIVLDDSERLRAESLSFTLLRLIDVPLLVLVREERNLNRIAHTHALRRPFSEESLQDVVSVALEYPRCIVVGALTLDLRQRTVRTPCNNNEPQRLPPKLFALLHFLMRHPGQTVSRNALMHSVWHTTFM